jgi:hypothetical protein
MSPNKRHIIDLTSIESPDAKRVAVEKTILATAQEKEHVVEETVLAPAQEKESSLGKDQTETEDDPPHRIPVFSENEHVEYRIFLPDDFTPAADAPANPFRHSR